MRICKYCNNEFENRIKKVDVCNDKECRKKHNNSKRYKKICIVCNSKYIGTQKSKICSTECKKKHQEKNILIIQDIICKKCNSHIGTCNKYVSIYGKSTVNKILYRTCHVCKLENYKLFSEKQKGENNSNWKPIKKKRNKYNSIDELKDAQSKYNGMKNKNVALKVGKTIKQKYKDGLLIRPLGKLSPLYKGNRKRSQTIRDRLKDWKQKHLINSNYTCQICNKRGSRLEIHHNDIPFRDILKDELNGRILDDVTYDEFEIICENIVKTHEDISGLVVCVDCHKDIDNYRK